MPLVAIRCVRRLSFRDPPMSVTLTIQSEGIYIKLALGDEYDIEGATPPFIVKFPPACEYYIQRPSPQTLDWVSHRISPRISLIVYFRKRRSRWAGTKSTHHGPTSHDPNHS